MLVQCFFNSTFYQRQGYKHADESNQVERYGLANVLKNDKGL
jgi:hypothetical protein